ncbi:MAG: 3-dehydroquinate synthase [Candidatus Omnitrophota bacterium]
MKKIRLNLKKRSYDILVGSSILNKAGAYLKKLELGSDAYVITNPVIKKLHGKKLAAALSAAGLNYKFRLIADSEESKSLKAAYSVIEDLAAFDKKKKVFVIAFGGGVTGDLAGFVASIYKRGIPYVQIPTTLLAQVDSSIGGKTAVDLSRGKNLIGAFYQPRLVLSDTTLIKTLNMRQVLSGLAEVIKYGAIKDPGLFRYLEKNLKKIIAKNSAALELIVSRSSTIKAKIVEADEREEKGLRTILNFGHTIGHAIEAAGDYKRYNHGEAIALGMLAACDIGLMLGNMDIDTGKRIEKLISASGLPVKIKKILPQKIIAAHYYDKKFSGAKNKFVIAEKIGRAVVRKNIPLDTIKAALKNRY